MIEITNTLTRRKEKIIPMQEGRLNMFVCGPTVYDFIHIGNARTFVTFDVVAKYLRHRGFEVDFIQNITDIDDKIIKKANEQGRDPLELAKDFEEKFKQDMSALKVTAVNKYIPATEHINEVVSQVRKLIDKGNAYLIEDDGYYFDLTTFPEYGKLSGRTTKMADDAVSRIDENDKKRNVGDFCLWKLSKLGEPSWNTEIGKGRPGWHIEDTAITEKLFGPQYDIHGGGQDLIFPHHEAEIAQQESASGLKPFVKYWMHVAFLVNKENKMSKSLGNFATAHELLEKYSPEALRFYLLSAHYKTPLDYSGKLIDQSSAAVLRIKEAYNKLKISDGTIDQSSALEIAKHKFYQSMDDNFNTSAAFASLFELINELNPLLITGSINKKSAEEIIDFFNEVDSILGIIPTKIDETPKEIKELIEKREKLREKESWKESDKIRTQINDLGYTLEDTVYGPFAKKH